MEIRRITSEVKPGTIEYLNNGNYYYNYDITSSVETVTDQEGKDREIVQYSFIQTKLAGQANYKDCTRQIIRLYVSQDEEFDLINSYNNYKAGLSNSIEDESKYLNYLALVETIKTKVKADFQII